MGAQQELQFVEASELWVGLVLPKARSDQNFPRGRLYDKASIQPLSPFSRSERSSGSPA